VYTQDQEVLQAASDWLNAGDAVWLSMIVSAVGSSPRPVGSLLVIRKDQHVGSLSGGCVEDDLLARVRAGELAVGGPELVEYGLTAAENERLGLPCGGRVKVLVQTLQPLDLPWIAQALAAIDERRCVQRVMPLGTGRSVLSACESYSLLSVEDDVLRQVFGPRNKMLLVGAGQLSQVLSQLALAMDYEVTVTDPRQQLIDQWPGPDVNLVQGMPDDVVREQAADKHSVVITLTHDPRIDDMALMEALESDAWYVGALGSVRTTEKRLRRLTELGMSNTDLARLHAPVGLPIGSKTPMEIAIAIMAEITQLQRQALAAAQREAEQRKNLASA
jgi:xanthine dehydrogenase accessory factor